ncbi:glycosyltransferase family 4 protein [Tenacibaculum jejuense]|uniref:Glycosyl transferase, group 1 family protein n=1 Tax=Tenacibaculum jejuense TaxID=584609 RepID=A0A238UEW4_9FLAO|nr:glycosyltransferase family 4 protein [Tenacibaculum jejuense]SNR17701.1 Glycosyl transferase, group 1 family protein [Tenacibaculum jejuense]
MVIVHVITAFGIGGAEKLLLNVANKQAENNKVHIIYLKKIHDLSPFLKKEISITYIPLSPLTVIKLRQYYKKVNAKIIHTHLSHADILGIIASLGFKAKVFCTMHNIYFKKNKIDSFLFFVYTILFKLKKTHVISISKSVKNHVISTLKQSKSRSFLLYNAIPSYKKELVKEENTTIQLLFVGRLVKQKSVSTLLKAIAILKKTDLKLTIVGDGNLRTYLEALAEKLNIKDKVYFVGQQKNIDSYFYNADVFILPSIWEGFGIVILEAFRAKLAIISSNIEGPAELIQHQKNGLLFTPKNDKELSEKLKELIDNPELRNKIAIKGYNTFTEKYHIDNYVKQLEKLYVNG